MIAIYKREMRAYFTTPIGYIFLAFFLATAALVFSLTTLYAMTTDVTGYFQVLLYGMIVLLPLLTMKLFSEERKQKTEQLLLTAPVSLFSMVFAKFLAAFTVYAGALTVTLLFFPILEIYGSVKLGMLFGNYLALLLAGMAFIAIGVFISALTENQLTAAVGTIGILILQLGISLLNSLLGEYWARFIVASLSVFSRFSAFTQGIFDYSAAIYYLSFTAIFLFLTVAVFHRRRYE
ncbi:MAG: ABC transporter permease [Clostridia bacterium]|nr:ABC transporter permease [Clostridia bacterium]